MSDFLSWLNVQGPQRPYARGGIVPNPAGSSVPMRLDPDECVLDRHGVCQRQDEAHYRDSTEIFSDLHMEPEKKYLGPCNHRHSIPVESYDGTEVLARLCRHCDTQIPA